MWHINTCKISHQLGHGTAKRHERAQPGCSRKSSAELLVAKTRCVTKGKRNKGARNGEQARAAARLRQVRVHQGAAQEPHQDHLVHQAPQVPTQTAMLQIPRTGHEFLHLCICTSAHLRIRTCRRLCNHREPCIPSTHTCMYVRTSFSGATLMPTARK